MKNQFKKILVSVLFSTFLIGLVSAAEGLTGLTEDFINGIVEIVSPYLGALLGADASGGLTSDMFIAKLLFAILIVCFVYVVLEKSLQNFFNNKKWALWIVSIIVAVLGVRFLTDDWIYTMLLPSNAFAVSVASIIPFVLYFFFVNALPTLTGQRMAWIFFGVVFLGLYSVRSSDLGAAAFVYPLTAILSFAMAAATGVIARLKARIRREKVLTAAQRRQYLIILKQRNELEEQLMTAIKNNADVATVINPIRAQIADIDNNILPALGF